MRNQSNTAWITMDATKLSGVIPLSALSVNFDTQVRSSRLDQMSSPTATLSMGNQLVSNVADPVNPTDVANRRWVLTQVQSAQAGIDSKPSVRFATTGNVTLSGLNTQVGGDWGVAMAEGDSVLVKNQTVASQNGIYLASVGAWTRRADADNGTELNSGTHVVVEEGALMATTSWILATPNPINLGSTSLQWNQFSTSAIYTAGNGISVSGNQITVIPANGGGVQVSSSGVAVDNTVVRRVPANTIVGDASTTIFTITHNQNKKGFPVFVTQAAPPNAQVRPGIQYDTANTFKVVFNVAPQVGTNYIVDWVA
jgi:phage-related tail fiber protein